MAGIRIDRAKLEHMLRGHGGLVDRNLRQRAARVVAQARADGPGSMGPRVMDAVISERGNSLSAKIHSPHPATLYVVNGTRPHQIRPVRARALRFTTGGRIVFAKLVNHPGTKPDDFLNKALREAL